MSITEEKPFEAEKLADIEYIAIRVHLRKDRSMSMKGLFAGYRSLVSGNTAKIVRKDDMYIWVMKNECIHILNADHWAVLSIEIKKKDGNPISHGLLKQDRQTARLGLIMEALKTNGMLEPGGLVDITKYENIPESLYDELSKTSNLYKRNVTHGRGTTGYGCDYHCNETGVYSRPAAKKPVTSEIKRTTKYPVGPAIQRMRIKIANIKSGKYKAPKLKSIPADKEDKEDESRKTTAEYQGKT
jgi:hypothetical protein